MPGLAELTAVAEHLVCCCHCRLDVVANLDALTGRQTASLDGHAGRAAFERSSDMALDSGDAALGAVEAPVLRTRNAVPVHHHASPPLVALDPGRAPGRAEGGDIGLVQGIDETSRQLRFRADDDQLDVVLLAERDVAGDIADPDRLTIQHRRLGELQNPGVPGGGEDVATHWRLTKLPTEDVFASAPAFDQDVHSASYGTPYVVRLAGSL